jgi:hypothetical protein
LVFSGIDQVETHPSNAEPNDFLSIDSVDAEGNSAEICTTVAGVHINNLGLSIMTSLIPARHDAALE